MKRALFIVLVVTALFRAGVAQALLIDQGNGLVYDDVSQIFWTQDADLSGRGNYAYQVAWADGFSLAGYSNFRLATIDELVGLYGQLPGAAGSDKTGDQGLFVNIRENYWSGTTVSGTEGWGFRFINGQADVGSLRHKYYGWAVTTEGIPEPGSLVLLALGLLGFGAVRRWRGR